MNTQLHDIYGQFLTKPYTVQVECPTLPQFLQFVAPACNSSGSGSSYSYGYGPRPNLFPVAAPASIASCATSDSDYYSMLIDPAETSAPHLFVRSVNFKHFILSLYRCQPSVCAFSFFRSFSPFPSLFVKFSFTLAFCVVCLIFPDSCVLLSPNISVICIDG